MNDIVITRSNSVVISSFKSFIQIQFQTKDFGLLKYFFVIEVSKCKKSIFLFQKKYRFGLLVETEKLGAKPCHALMTHNLQLIAEDSELFEGLERYGRLVSKLNYLTMIRLDVIYSISVVSQFMSSPTIVHW